MNRFFILWSFILCWLCIACQTHSSKEESFDECVLLMEYDPRLYLAKTDTIHPTIIKHEQDAINFLLTSLARNHLQENWYPSQEQLKLCIYFFQRKKWIHPQLETLLLLARSYQKEQKLDLEIATVEEGIGIALNAQDSDWLFRLYSYLGNKYFSQCNMIKFVKYQTLANQCIKEEDTDKNVISTKIQLAKGYLYINHYQKAYDLLQTLEIRIPKTHVYYNDMKRLLGIALYKQNQWEASIQKMQEAIITENLPKHLFVCHSILTYNYYFLGDLPNAQKHKK